MAKISGVVVSSPGRTLELGQQVIKLGPIFIILGKLAMFGGFNVLYTSEQGFNVTLGVVGRLTSSKSAYLSWQFSQ